METLLQVPPITLHDFVRQAWHVVEPRTPFIDNWHIAAICEHLEAVSLGVIRRLLMNIPPGHMKSLLTSVFWPAWMWTWRPEWRCLTGSYGKALTIRDAVKTRDIITSPWYREAFNPAWRLTSDTNAKTHYKNSVGGERMSISVDSQTTGFRGDAVIIDDPLPAMKAFSEAERHKVNRWFEQAVGSRVNDPRHGAIVLMMQRVHEDDPAGRCLKRGGYEHLCLPTEFDGSRRCTTSIGFEDPRTTDRELLFPQLFPRHVVDEAKILLLDYGFSAQHQQLPTPEGGAMFKREWFADVWVDSVPVEGTRVRYWDRAATEGGGDWTVGVLMTRGANGLYYIEDVVRGQWGSPDVERNIRLTAKLDAERYGNSVIIALEQEPGSSGVSDVRHLLTALAGYPTLKRRPTGSKELRARPLASQFAAGNVRIAERPWKVELLTEFTAFPGHGAHDDQVDAASGAFDVLTKIQ